MKQYFCSIEFALDCISGKWKSSIIYHLKKGPKRFGQLAKLIPKASKKVLSNQLKELENDDLILRTHLVDTVPLGTEYRLSKQAKDLCKILQLLHEWGIKEAHRKSVTIQLNNPEEQ